MDYSTLGFPVHHQFLELTQTHVHQVGDAIQPSHPLSSPSPPTLNLSQHQSLFRFSSGGQRVQVSTSASVLSKNIQDWFPLRLTDLLAVQGTLKSLLQHHSSRASVLQRSAYFTIQLSHPYMTTGKTIALTRWTFVGKVMSLLFKMLSRLVIVFFQGASVF